MQNEQDANPNKADLVRNNTTTAEEESSQQQRTAENFNISNVKRQHKSSINVGLAPGSSVDWITHTFVGGSGSGDTTTSKAAFTSTTNTSSSTQGSSSSSSTVAMTEPQNETNINGLTGNLKQMTLSPKSVSF